MSEPEANNSSKTALIDRIHIKQAPSPRQVYWISAPDGAKAPEFTGYHPGIIIRGCKTLFETKNTVIFVPITSTEPRVDEKGNYPRNSFELTTNPNPSSDRRVWAVCSHIMTANLTRLRAFRTKEGHRVPKISNEDFEGVLDTIIWNQGALRSHIENILNDYLDEAHEKHQAEIDCLKASFKAELDRKVEERARELARQMIEENNSALTI